MQAKGTNLLLIEAFVRQRFGSNGWERVLAALSELDRATLGEVVAVGWYDFELQLRLLRAADGVLGDGSLATEFGRFEAEEDLTKIHRLFLRLASPAFVLEKSGEYWNRFYSAGHWDVSRQGERAATAVLCDVDPADELFCRYLTAYVTRMFELIGARSPAVVHTECRGRGEPRCVFRGSWS